MATEVGAFTSRARQEFMEGKLAADMLPMPAAYDPFVTTLKSDTRLDTHVFMSNLPRLREFKGATPFSRITNNSYETRNLEFRIGLTVRKTDLDDDQTGGYLKTIKALPQQGQKDIGFRILQKVANGTSTSTNDLGFDGAAMFADSHNIGSGDNLMTVDNAGNDGATHKIVAMIPTNPVIKPILFTDRESLGVLDTDADTPQGRLQKEFQYWSDCRFGLGYGFWWDAIHITITDTPTMQELLNIVKSLVDRFRTFTLPKGNDVDDAMYVHEGWMPSASDFTLLCNMSLGTKLSTLHDNTIITADTSGAPLDNDYKGKFTLIPTSALGA